MTLIDSCPCRCFLIHFFLSFSSMMLILLFFIVFAEFCWEIRLSTPNLCLCDFFLTLFRLVSFTHMFSHFLLDGYDVMLWLPLGFHSCSDWRPRWTDLPNDWTGWLYLLWLAIININLNLIMLWSSHGPWALVIITSITLSCHSVLQNNNIALLLHSYLTELEREKKLRSICVDYKNVHFIITLSVIDGSKWFLVSAILN